MEMEPGEGKKHEMGESTQEELREGAEPDDMPMGKTNRKRSAKNAKNTKAPMDGGMYGKKPMDGEGCNCGKRKAKCDGSCGKKMDRNDALTPQEYLDACELGIQGRSRTYIRARLDTSSRVDKKCGASGIPDNKECRVGKEQPAQSQKGGGRKITLTGPETGLLSRQRIAREGYYGAALGGNAFGRRSQAKRYGALYAATGGVLGALQGGMTGGISGALLGAAGGATVGGLAGAASGAMTAQVNRSTSRSANRSLQREAMENSIVPTYKARRSRMKAKGASREAINQYDLKTAMKLASGYDRIHQQTRGRFGLDSAYADGFTPDYAQLSL